MEDFNRCNLVVSPLVRTSSNEALSLLSDSSVSPATTTDLISENSTSNGASPNALTPTLNLRPDLYSQTCSFSCEDIDSHQMLPIHKSRMPDSDCSEHMLITTTEDLVEILGLVNYLNQRWKHHLDQSLGRDERFALFAPFEEGLENLQKFYRGTLPTTFKEIFALMHVVYACGRCYHREDEISFWHDLFMDVLQWRYSIATREDSILFIQVAFELWADQECSGDEAAMYSFNFVSQISWSHSQPSTLQATRGSELSYEMDKLDLAKLRDLLGEGESIRVCTSYFGGFVYAKIYARNIVEASQLSRESDTPLKADTQTCTIDKPLQRESADTPDETLVEAQPDLRSGPLPNPDEEANAKLAPSPPAEIASPISSTSPACDICKKSFNAKKDRDQRGSFRRHMKTKHALEKISYPCPVPECGRTFPRRDNLKRHVQKHHEGVDLPDACGESPAKKQKTADI